MVEVLFLFLGITLAFVFMQYEQKKDLEKRVKTLESDYLSICSQLEHIERSLQKEVEERIHALKADMWKIKSEYSSLQKILKD